VLDHDFINDMMDAICALIFTGLCGRRVAAAKATEPEAPRVAIADRHPPVAMHDAEPQALLILRSLSWPSAPTAIAGLMIATARALGMPSVIPMSVHPMLSTTCML
jgi:hypothetical protein